MVTSSTFTSFRFKTFLGLARTESGFEVLRPVLAKTPLAKAFLTMTLLAAAPRATPLIALLAAVALTALAIVARTEFGLEGFRHGAAATFPLPIGAALVACPATNIWERVVAASGARSGGVRGPFRMPVPRLASFATLSRRARGKFATARPFKLMPRPGDAFTATRLPGTVSSFQDLLRSLRSFAQ